jgi:hypothetical protein
MSLKDHITRIQQKPQHQRERIAVIATAVAFLFILSIWILTFSEMNKSTQTEANSPANEQLNDLKNSAGEGKKSIEEMWNQMPTQEDMIDAEKQTVPPENKANDSDINQDIQDNGSSSNKSIQGDEASPADGGKNTSNEIPPLP